MNKLWMLLLLFGLSSCATYEQQRAASTGAMIGGAAGAVLGAESDRVLEGAAIGAAIGAVTGAVTGAAISDSQRAAHKRQVQQGAALKPYKHAKHSKQHHAKKTYKHHQNHERWEEQREDIKNTRPRYEESDDDYREYEDDEM